MTETIQMSGKTYGELTETLFHKNVDALAWYLYSPYRLDLTKTSQSMCSVVSDIAEALNDKSLQPFSYFLNTLVRSKNRWFLVGFENYKGHADVEFFLTEDNLAYPVVATTVNLINQVLEGDVVIGDHVFNGLYEAEAEEVTELLQGLPSWPQVIVGDWGFAYPAREDIGGYSLYMMRLLQDVLALDTYSDSAAYSRLSILRDAVGATRYSVDDLENPDEVKSNWWIPGKRFYAAHDMVKMLALAHEKEWLLDSDGHRDAKNVIFTPLWRRKNLRVNGGNFAAILKEVNPGIVDDLGNIIDKCED